MRLTEDMELAGPFHRRQTEPAALVSVQLGKDPSPQCLSWGFPQRQTLRQGFGCMWLIWKVIRESSVKEWERDQGR